MPVFPLHTSLNLFLGKPREVDSERSARFDLTGENVHFVEEHESLGHCQLLEIQSNTQRAHLGPFYWCSGLVQANRFSSNHPGIDVDSAMWMEDAFSSLEGDV